MDEEKIISVGVGVSVFKNEKKFFYIRGSGHMDKVNMPHPAVIWNSGNR